MKRSLIVLLILIVAAIAAYVGSPAFRVMADAVLPNAVRTPLVATLSTLNLMADAGPQPASAAKPAGKSGKRGAGVVSVAAAVAGRGDMPILEFAIGYAESPAVVSVSSRVTSQVVAQHVTDGQEVEAGDLLFTLDDRSFKAQLAKDEATLARDEALQATAAANLERAKSLYAQQTASKQTLDQAVAADKTAAADVAADKATIETDQLEISYTRITAPISGRLGALKVHSGDIVNAGGGSSTTTLVTVTQMQPMRVSFALPTDRLPTVRKALASGTAPEVDVYSPGDYGTAGSKPIASGKLDFIDSSVNTAAGSVVVKASFPNKDEALWPGQYVNVVVKAGVARDLTTVPTVAVQQGQSGPFVFVVKNDNTTEIRPVTIRLSQGDTTGLGSGLTPGERVVTEGQLKLKNGSHVLVKGANSSEKSASGAGSNAQVAPPATKQAKS